MLTSVLKISLICAASSLAPFATVQAQDYRHGNGDAVECRSEGRAYQRCDVPWRDARLVRQLSDTRCVRGKTWGIDREGLWVDHGCSGQFAAAGGRDRDRDRRDERGDHNRDRADERGAWQPDASWNTRFSVTCESQDNQNHFCQVDLGGGGAATLERQLSNTRCVEGENWGSNRAGVWVSDGCRGVFSIDRRWR